VATDKVPFRFEDARRSAGIDLVHFPARRRSMLPEDMGSGAAWGDYDDDGDPDLFLVNFRGSILSAENDQGAGRSALYRNDGDGTFTDVTAAAGLERATFGLAASWGDYDDDGDLDLYLTNYGPNVLYRNEEDGSFVDVTETAGVGDDRFSAGSAWGDYDNDGDIDLYVTTYVDFVYDDQDQKRATRQYSSETPYTLNPSSYAAATNRLYRNDGDGTFTDVADGTPVANPTGRSLGAVWFDFDLDGFLDLYVANDVSDNGVYHNRGDGTFADIGASSLAADYRGAMGLAVGDYEQDGDFDLFVTHWIAQENAFFENMHAENWKDDHGKRRLFFMDAADSVGLGQISLKNVGWATGFADLDNDGHLDLWVVNGNTLELEDDNSRLKPQLMQLFWQDPGKGFFEVARQASGALETPLVGRGGAHADYDGDGRVDIAVMVHGGQPLLLHNVSVTDRHWITLRLRQSGGNSRALGARVLVRSGPVTQLAQVGTGGSYLSQSPTDLHFGLADRTSVDEVTIYWPDGTVDKRADIEADRVVLLTHSASYAADR
jgi:hypothetical protein|tara:strand:+ start:8118 stop:9758 length:1641 start_codon:yes stop_codon:yes gene_type:complete